MDNPLIFLTAVLVLGFLSQWIAWRLRIPSILVLLACGFFAGYAGGFRPDDVFGQELLFPAVSLAVSVILLEGGLTLQFHELKTAGTAVFRLVSIGVVVSALLGGLAAYFILGMHWRVALLTGAILVVTGPTVVAPLLRSIRPSKRLNSVIKWEGIVIDPIGAVLAVLVFEALFSEHGSTIIVLLKSLAVGFGLGLGAAWWLTLSLKRYMIPDYLHSLAILASSVGVFTASNLIAAESGLITVTVLGIALANQRQVPVSHILEFKENLRTLLISSLFIVLAARIELQALLDLSWRGIAFLAVLILVVRPVSVIASTIGTKMTWNERLFLCFLAPRGIVAAAVSSIFALELSHHLDGDQVFTGTEELVPITFLVIVGTVAVYGLSAAPLARRLGLSVPNPQGILFAGAAPWVREIAKTLAVEKFPILLVDTNYRNVADARMMDLKAECGSVVSEYVTEEIDLAGIGKLLAMTPNDDLNSLACMEFSHLFGRAEVYQLPLGKTGAGHRQVSGHIRGRFLFHQDAEFTTLAARMQLGWQIKKTRITEEFTFAQFRDRYGESAMLLFIISQEKLIVCTAANQPVLPKIGQTVIALVETPPQSKTASRNPAAPPQPAAPNS